MQRPLAIALVLVLLYPSAASRTNAAAKPASAAASLRVLLVVAHPDDEYEMAGTVYRIAKELSGTVDQLIITDGEAGYHYSSLAERYYNRNLTEESAGRKSLPSIRRKEARQAARILGIRHQWFLNEKDERFTLSAQEVLVEWHTDRVLQAIGRRLRQGHYDYLFVLLPAKDTHGAHKAASILALEAVEQLPRDQRPVVLAAEAGATNSGSYQPVDQFPITSTVTPDPKLHFDRDGHFGYRNSLTYQIVVNWVIAEHKSQGLFQNRWGQDRFENFWFFQTGPPASHRETNPVSAGGTNTINGARRDLTAIPRVLTN